MRSTTMRGVALALSVALAVVCVPMGAYGVSAQTATRVITTGDLTCVTFATSSVGYAATSNGAIMKTSDAGATWSQVRPVDGKYFTGVAFWDALSGIAVTREREVIGTDDGGVTWTTRNSDLTSGTVYPEPMRVNGVAAVPGKPTQASLAGGDPDPSDSMLIPEQVRHTEMMSPPAGSYWWVRARFCDYYDDPPEEYNSPGYYGEGEFFAIDYVDSTHGWAVGADYWPSETTSSMAATVDGGATWTRRYLGRATVLKAVSFATTSTGVTTSADGRVFVTSDGGTTWSEGSSGVSVSLNGVAMLDATHGWAVGDDGVVLATTDGGVTWTPVPSGTTQDLLAVTTVGSLAVAVGRQGTVVTLGESPDVTAPQVTSLSSSTHPSEDTWYAHNDPAFSWEATDASGVTGYSYSLDQDPSTTPPATDMGAATSKSYTDVVDGVSYFHVRALDAAGNWGPARHLRVMIDTTPPVTSVESTSVAPGSGSITLASYDAHSGVAQVLWEVEDGPSGSGTTVTLAGAGTYTVRYHAIDNAGNAEEEQSVTLTVPPTELIVTPIAGDDRIQTAILAARTAFPEGADTVVIATAFNWPDALGGAALAGALDAPILLTAPGTLSSGVSAELAELGAEKAVILGGTGAVSGTVEAALKTRLGDANVTRVWGADRYETAREVAEATAEELGADYDGTAFVATGANFPDALGASPLAAAKGWPIYLADPRGVDSALTDSMRYIGVTDAIMLGGTGAVSTAIESGVRSGVPCSTDRWQGANRYATALEVATHGVNDAGLGWDKVAIATGEDFPDALAGGVLQGASGSVMLLTPRTSLFGDAAATLSAQKTDINEVRFLGGLSAINQSVRDAVLAALAR